MHKRVTVCVCACILINSYPVINQILKINNLTALRHTQSQCFSSTIPKLPFHHFSDTQPAHPSCSMSTNILVGDMNISVNSSYCHWQHVGVYAHIRGTHLVTINSALSSNLQVQDPGVSEEKVVSVILTFLKFPTKLNCQMLLWNWKSTDTAIMTMDLQHIS